MAKKSNYVKIKIRESLRKKWATDKNFVKMMVDSRFYKPNGPEKVLIDLISKNRFPYKYTGNGKFWVDRVNPDFINNLGEKKAIELNGCYWHDCPKCYPNGGSLGKNIERDKLKNKIYKNNGWKVLIIWDHELKNLSKVSSKMERLK